MVRAAGYPYGRVVATNTDERDHARRESTDDIEIRVVGGAKSGRVVGGVAADLGRRLDVDPLWPRLAFVGLTLFGGLGLLAYAGLWLMLIAARRPGWSMLRYLGGAVLVVGGGIMLAEGRTDPVGGPLAVAASLTGLAVALWQPRAVPALAEAPTRPDVYPEPPPVDAARVGPIRRTLHRRRRRPRSVLGRAALGVALITAAAVALIDELNGGRLHPEQWLGAAALVCGLGALVGAWRGRALWLVLPGLVFAASGYVSGHAARAGVQSWRWGDAYYWIGADGQAIPQPGDPGRVIGSAFLTIDDVPPARRDVSLRAGVGDVAITLDEDVTLEIRALLFDGRITVDDVEQPMSDNRATLMLGPEGVSDLLVNVTISDGDLRVLRQEMTPTYPTERADADTTPNPPIDRVRAR